MTLAPNTHSTLTFDSGKNKTSTSLSTNILIMVGNTAVGAVQSLAISEKRGIKMIDEVGNDGHVDSVPNVSANFTGTCQRIRFDRLRIAEAFSRGYIHIQSQAYPFDIVIIDRQKGSDVASQISTVIKNVWISGIDYTYQVSDWVITESMTWEAETIYSTLNNGPVARGGERQIPLSIIPLEQGTDTGANGRRGSLDASGLINLGSTGDIF